MAENIFGNERTIFRRSSTVAAWVVLATLHSQPNCFTLYVKQSLVWLKDKVPTPFSGVYKIKSRLKRHIYLSMSGLFLVYSVQYFWCNKTLIIYNFWNLNDKRNLDNNNILPSEFSLLLYFEWTRFLLISEVRARDRATAAAFLFSPILLADAIYLA